MKNLALIAFLLASTPAFAQDKPADTPTPAPTEQATPAPAPSPAQQPKSFFLELDQNDINALSLALQELPKKVADPLILKLQGQLTVQAKIAEGYAAATKPAPSKKGK